MELHQRSCVLPSNAPALLEPDSSIPSRVLQERSGNRRHGYADASSSWKRSSSPVEKLYTHRSGGSYFSGNLVAQLSCEKSEDQISYETRRLLQSLQRCEKYRKYRDRQPQNAKERELKWPDNMEEAFFRALVRWPPMGRRKLMHDGSLRGRNELVADSIYKETGLPRTRKQVSSHIQVLKNFFIDQPNIAIYMSTEDMGSKRSRHASSHLSHLRGRQGLGPSASRYNSPSQTGAGLWDGFDYLPSSSHGMGRLKPQEDSSYTVTDFALWISDEKKHPTHYLSQLAQPSRHGDLNIIDLSSWHKQYREFEFMRAEDWKDRQVLVCDASILVMTEPQPPRAELSTQFLLKSSNDLGAYSSLQCRTRFYDSGELADQGPKEGPAKMETIGKCSYDDKLGALIPFGSNFWVKRTSKLSNELRQAKRCEETSHRSKMEMGVRRSLQYLTAVQDIWGTTRDTGENVCLLTILWRFHQTSSEPGRMKWRVVNFSNLQNTRGMKHTHSNKGLADMVTSTAANSLYPSLPLDFSHQPFTHPPQLDLDTLGTSALEGMSDFSNPNSATAPSMTTDYSQTHSIPSLTHSHDSSMHPQPHDYHDTNDLDFTGGHINICLEPAINLGAYESHLDTPSLHANPNPLHALATYDHTTYDPQPAYDHPSHHDTAHQDPTFADLGLGLHLQSCYHTRPTWPYTDLISRFEGIAEQSQSQSQAQAQAQHDFHTQPHPASHHEDIAGHGVLHDGQMSGGLWKLQTGFGADTGVGAGMGADGRKDSGIEGHGGQGILELIERKDWRDV